MAVHIHACCMVSVLLFLLRHSLYRVFGMHVVPLLYRCRKLGSKDVYRKQILTKAIL